MPDAAPPHACTPSPAGGASGAGAAPVEAGPRDRGAVSASAALALTGSTGFLGQALVREALAAGWSLRVLVRDGSRAASLKQRGAAVIVGDLGDARACAALVRPGDVLVHAAARVGVSGPGRGFRKAIVDGTRALLQAALPQRPARVVYVSSAAVYLGWRGAIPVAADRVRASPPAHAHYARAKLAAEEIVRQACGRAGVTWVIVRLGFLYGPGNRSLETVLGELHRRGRLRLVGSGENRIAALHVEDAARAVLLTATHPAAWGTYDAVGDERVSQRRFIEAHLGALGIDGHVRRVPRPAAVLGAWLGELLGTLIGVEPLVSRWLVELLAADQQIDAGRIRRELGWQPLRCLAGAVRSEG